MYLLKYVVLLFAGCASANWEDWTFYNLNSLASFFKQTWVSDWWSFPDLHGRPNLVQLAGDLNLTKCVEALTQVQLAQMLDHEGWYTLFCPTNEAFMHQKFYPGVESLTDKMRFHVARGMFNTSDFKNEFAQRSLLAGRDVRINVYTTGKDPTITANGRPVISFDHLARNGFLHVTSEVMSSVYDRQGSVVSELEFCCPQFSFFLGLIRDAGLWELVDKSEPITLLAPLNRAFDRIHPDLVNHLKQNKPLLKKVLSNHIIPGTWYTAGLNNGDELKTWAGEYIKIVKDKTGNIRFSQAGTGMTDMTTCNGAVHAVSKLVLPRPLEREIRALLAN